MYSTVKLTLPLPTGISPSASLYAAGYDVSSGLWVALPVPEKLVGGQGEALTRVTLPGPGSIAVLVPDPVPTAPPSLPDSPGTPLVGSSLPDDAMHSPNEKLSLPAWRGLIETFVHFFCNLA